MSNQLGDTMQGKITRLETISRENSLLVVGHFPPGTPVRMVQATTHRLCAELLESIDQGGEISEFKGCVYVDQSRQGDLVGTVTMEYGTEEFEDEKAAAIAEVVHDMTELLVDERPEAERGIQQTTAPE